MTYKTGHLYHSFHLLGDLVSAKMVVKGALHSPVWWIVANGISALTVHLGYRCFFIFLETGTKQKQKLNFAVFQWTNLTPILVSDVFKCFHQHISGGFSSDHFSNVLLTIVLGVH